MKFQYNDEEYDVNICKKITNKNTYIRVKNDLTIQVTTNTFTSDREILKLINDNSSSIIRMINSQLKKKESNEGFFYLGSSRNRTVFPVRLAYSISLRVLVPI